jgi:WD40 repeat protein
VREIQTRFPEYASTLLDQIELHRAMSADSDVVNGLRDAVGGLRGPSQLSQQDTHRSAPSAQLTNAPGTRLPVHLTHFVSGYEILSELGRGGMGIVYRARQLSLNRLVALKMLRAGDCGSTTLLARFQAEAEAVARLHHPNIVQIYDYGEHDGMPYLALELIEGGPLSALPSGKAKSPREAAEIVVTLARAVQFAHEQGIVHRDLKPANILVAVAASKGVPARNAIKITDFGLAKVFREGEESHTLTGTIVGTPNYMAPEQACGRSHLVGPATDVYALGAILYELITGQPPFKAVTAIETLQQVLKQEPPPLSRLNPRVPPDLATICAKCLSKEPSRRYVTAAALAGDLERFLSDRPILARRTTILERSWRWCRRNPALALLGTTVALLLLAVAAVSSISSVRLGAQLEKTVRAEDAEREAKRTAQLRLWDAYLAEINARTVSRKLGHRFAALETADEANILLEQIGRTPDRELQLRNATMTALALPDMRRLRLIDGQRCRAIDCTLSADRYVTATDAGDLSLYDLEGRELVRIEHHGNVESLAVSRDGKYVGVSDLFNSKIWRIDGEKATLIWDQPGERFGLAPDCRHAVVVTSDQAMHWLDLETGQLLHTIGRGVGRSNFGFHLPSRRMAVLGTDSVQVISWDTGAVLSELPAEPSALVEVAWHPSGEYLAVSGNEDGVALWHVASGRRAMVYSHIGVVKPYFLGDGDYLLTHNLWESNVRMWHTGTGEEVLDDPTFPHFQSELMPDGRHLLLAKDEAGIALWEVELASACASLPHELVLSVGWRTSASIDSEGRYLLIGGASGLQLWDLETMQLAARLESSNAFIRFATDGSIMARHESGVFRWPRHVDPSGDGSVTMRFGPPERLFGDTIERKFAMVPDGSEMAVRTPEGWQVVRQGKPEQTIATDPAADRRTVSLSNDSAWLALGSFNGHGVAVFSPRTGEPIANLPTGRHAQPLFSPDGRWLATTPDGVKLWSTASWSPVVDVRACGDTASTLTITFSSDSSVLVVSQATGEIRLVDPTSGGDVAILQYPDQNAGSYIEITEDQTRLVSVPHAVSRAVRIWDLSDLRKELACRKLDWPSGVLPPLPARSSPASARPTDVVFVPTESWSKGEAATLLTRARSTRGTTKREFLMQAVRLDPENAVAHNLLSWLLATGPLELRDPPQAVVHARRAVALDPGCQNYANTLGVALQRAGQHTEAVVVLEDSLKRSTPQFAPHDLIFLALAHAGLDQWEAASDYFRRTAAAVESQGDAITPWRRDELRKFLEEAKALGLPR